MENKKILAIVVGVVIVIIIVIVGLKYQSNTTSQQGSTQNTTPVDCVVSDWSPWSSCPINDATTGYKQGVQTRSRTIITQPSNNGLVCPPLTDSQDCNDCKVKSAWNGICNPWTLQETGSQQIQLLPKGDGAVQCPTNLNADGTIMSVSRPCPSTLTGAPGVIASWNFANPTFSTDQTTVTIPDRSGNNNNMVFTSTVNTPYNKLPLFVTNGTVPTMQMTYDPSLGSQSGDGHGISLSNSAPDLLSQLTVPAPYCNGRSCRSSFTISWVINMTMLQHQILFLLPMEQPQDMPIILLFLLLKTKSPLLIRLSIACRLLSNQLVYYLGQ